jgi:lipopolysaccharide export system permease protein
MIDIYKKYIYKKFLISLTKILVVFFCITFVMGLLEEINFFKNSNHKVFLPLILTLMNSPSVIFEILPFIFLLSTIYFFFEFIETEELNNLKIYGITNLNLLKNLTAMSFILGIVVIFVFYNISASLKFSYLKIKNKYSSDDKYLAVVTENGLWIKDNYDNKIRYINSDQIQKNYLFNISISEFDKNYILERSIFANKANISEKKWILEEVIVNINNKIKKFDQYEIRTNFDQNLIITFFDNMSSLTLFDLEKRAKTYDLLGYNSNLIKIYKHKLYSYPFYIVLMVIIGSLLMLRINYKKSKVFYVIFGILISVIIYYINFFFGALIEISKNSYIISIWFPKLILILITLPYLKRINEK